MKIKNPYTGGKNLIRGKNPPDGNKERGVQLARNIQFHSTISSKWIYTEYQPVMECHENSSVNVRILSLSHLEKN